MNSIRTLVLVVIGLMALLALTVGAAELPLGEAGLLVSLAIAAAKALLVMWFFMHVRFANGATRVAVMAGFVWLSLLFGLTVLEYATR